jgi:hypothetical protein
MVVLRKQIPIGHEGQVNKLTDKLGSDKLPTCLLEREMEGNNECRITLCGRITQISMSTHGTSTEEDFEVVKFIENNNPFAMLLGKPWIEKDQARRKEEKVLE